MMVDDKSVTKHVESSMHTTFISCTAKQNHIFTVCFVLCVRQVHVQWSPALRPRTCINKSMSEVLHFDVTSGQRLPYVCCGMAKPCMDTSTLSFRQELSELGQKSLLLDVQFNFCLV